MLPPQSREACRVGRVGIGNRSAEEQGQKPPEKQNIARKRERHARSGVHDGNQPRASLARAALHVHPNLSTCPIPMSSHLWGSMTV